MWDVQVGERIRKYRGHQTFVNTCNIARRGPQLLCSGSDDGTLRVCQTFHVHTEYNDKISFGLMTLWDWQQLEHPAGKTSRQGKLPNGQ